MFASEYRSLLLGSGNAASRRAVVLHGRTTSGRRASDAAIAGDLIGPFQSMDRLGDPEFAKVGDLLRNADAGFANQEGAIFDLSRFTGYPAAETGGWLSRATAFDRKGHQDMGISLVSKANNHATDYGPEGLVETLGNLTGAGLVSGGAELSDSAVRRPVYLDTRKGVVALVATASTFPPSSVAGAAFVGRIGRQDRDLGSGPFTSARYGCCRPRSSNLSGRPPDRSSRTRDRRSASAIRCSGKTRPSETRWEMDSSGEKAILGAVDEAKKREAEALLTVALGKSVACIGDGKRPVLRR